jgi:serine phosphatase RsbU (regulator of sigma subunit)
MADSTPSSRPDRPSAAADASTPKIDTIEVRAVAASRGRLLIIDYNDASAEHLARYLGTEGFSVSVTGDGAEALTLLERHSFDLVLLDWVMPRMSGVRVLERIRRSYAASALPVVMTTVIDASESVVEALRAGANDYVLKPLDLPVVVARIDAQLVLKRARERIERDLRIAREIQNSLLPRQLPARSDAGGLELHATFTPAREVGGDLYDFFFIDERHLCLMIGDVADKSVPAALYMMAARFALRMEARGTLQPEEILRRVNQTLSADNDKCIFVSAICGVFDVGTGDLHIASAGHNAPILRRRDGSATSLEVPQGLVLGALADSTYRARRLRLQPGELIVLYTDGVTEALDPQGQQFGTPRLLDCVARLGGDGAAALVAGLERELARFGQGTPPTDDSSLLALRYDPRR